MKLTNVSATNLKGLTFGLPLKPITFLCGPNYSGKTARTDAIRLALAGFLPELGKTNAATFGLSSGKEMEVAVTVDDGTSGGALIDRVWTAKGDSIKGSAALPLGMFPKGDNQLFEVMLNAESWFGLTERERVEWVFANSTIEANGKVDAAYESLKSSLAEHDQKVIDRLLSEWVDDARKESNGTTGPLLQVWIEAMLRYATAAAKNAKAHAMTMDKTVQGLAGLRASDQQPVNVAEVERKMEAIQVGLDKLREEAAAQRAILSAQGKQDSRRSELQRIVSGKAGIEAERGRRLADLEALRNRLNTVYAQRDVYPEGDAAEIASWREEQRDALVARDGHRNNLNSVISMIENNEAELAELDSKTRCPYCGAEGVMWKALKRGEIESALAGLRSKKETLTEHVAKVAETAEVFGKRIKAAEARANERADLQKQINAMIEQVRQAEAGVKGTDAIIAGYAGNEGELAAIPLPDAEASRKVEELDERMRARKLELVELDNQRKLALGRAAEVKRLAEAEKGRAEAKEEQRIAEAAAESLRGIKAKMVADAFVPLLKVANEFCGSLLLSPLAFNPANSEVGTWHNGGWVGHKTMSGVERLLAYAGIQAALAAKAPVRVMILDEMLRARGHVFKALLEQCVRAVRVGMIDNFIGIVPTNPGEVLKLPDNWKDEDCQIVVIS